jgi:hypothetical protein
MAVAEKAQQISLFAELLPRNGWWHSCLLNGRCLAPGMSQYVGNLSTKTISYWELVVFV